MGNDEQVSNSENRKIPKGAILDSLRIWQTEYRKTGAWLENNLHFDTDYYLDIRLKYFAKQLLNSFQLPGGYKRELKERDFEILLANLLRQPSKPISISLNQNDWKQTRYNKCSYYTVSLISILYNRNYIDMKKGYKVESDSRITRIWPTDQLLKYFPENRKGVFWEPSQLVILRDSKGKLLEYKDTNETWRIRTILQRVNDVNSRTDIRYHQHKLNVFLVAIFKERLTWYGRLHSRGFRHFQGFSGVERAEITINGDLVVELDYSGLHPNLLYASEGIQYNGDPYNIVDGRSEARPFLKQILLSMLNSKDKPTAEKAANYWLYHNHAEREALHSIGITNARPLIDKFFEAHKSISHYFCKGRITGLQVMNKDSKIALDVVDHFSKLNIPILAIHDSFIVQKQHKEELYQVMRNVYYKHSGFSINVK